jgi:hypothetical protein
MAKCWAWGGGGVVGGRVIVAGVGGWLAVQSELLRLQPPSWSRLEAVLSLLTCHSPLWAMCIRSGLSFSLARHSGLAAGLLPFWGYDKLASLGCLWIRVCFCSSPLWAGNKTE